MNPIIGSEQGGIRPVLVIQNDVGNLHSPTVVIAPLTTQIFTKHRIPTHSILLNFPKNDLNSMVLLEQIRTIDKSRIIEYMGKASNEMMRSVDNAILISLGIALPINPRSP